MGTFHTTGALRFIWGTEDIQCDLEGNIVTCRRVKVLQQCWVDIETGDELWLDVPLEENP